MARGFGRRLDDSGELLVENGSNTLGDTTQQNQRVLLLAAKGELKHAPFVGIGVASFINDEEATSSIVRDIRLQLKDDGQTVQRISLTKDGEVEIVAGYNNN